MKMNELIIFVSGFLIGSGLTWVAIKDYYEKKYDDDRAVLRDIYSKRYNSTSDSNNEQETPENGLKTQSVGYSNNTFIKKLNELARTDLGGTKSFKDYTSMYGGDDISDEDEDAKESDRFTQIQSIQASKENPVEEKLPYILTEDEWNNPSPAYDKITLEYFVEDDILIDSLSHEILDVSSTITESNIDYLNETDEDYIYVRNDSKGCDYEVIKNYDEYVDAEKGYYGIY